jgi:phospholipid/cholesterol/gamma-HCH transport system substrate-binding protein
MNVAREIRVGLFVLIGLVLSGVVVFLIGDERRMFDSSESYRASFDDVQGLKAGAPVRMGGVDVGTVTEVGYSLDTGDARVYVVLDVVASEAERIRENSRVRVADKGMLGDKMVEITRGDMALPKLPAGTFIPPSDEKGMIDQLGDMAKDAKGAISRIRDVSDELANEDLHRNIRSSAASLDIILHEVARGDGYPHRVLTDPQEAERISRTIQNLDLAIVELTATLREVRGVSARVKDGPGFAHDMIYGAGPTKPMEQLGDAAGEVALTLRGVREGDGVAHDVLYGGDGGHGRKAMEDLAAITGDLRAMVGDVRKGRGTVGALLVDPSLYEDVKLLVGNVSRNDVLRALVRYSIKQDEPRPSVQVGAAP